jgi:hypothetical protein
MGKSEVLVALSEWREATGRGPATRDGEKRGFGCFLDVAEGDRKGWRPSGMSEKKDPGCFYVVAWKDRGIETKKAHRYGALF